MKNPYRGSLLLALLALLIMTASGHFISAESVPAAAGAVLLAERDGLRLFAEAEPPEGEIVVYDRETLYRGGLMYVGPDTPLPDDLPAQQTRDVRSLVHLYIPAAEHVALSEDTIYALCRLVEQNPLVGTWIMTGMRSPREQQALQEQAFAAYRQILPVAQALAQAARDVPDSGRSEHQLATAFDVKLNGRQIWNCEDPMARTADGKWLLQNAWRFGFIRRYPPEKADITGITGESTHWRYVGRAHAAAMHAADHCLEEYLQMLHERGTLRLIAEDGGEAWLLCREMGADGAVFPIPAGWHVAVSADNLGYAVCALTRDQSSFSIS